MAQCGTCNWSYMTENWQSKWHDRWWWWCGETKHVHHVIRQCRCRIKSYLKVMLSPSSTVMFSGRCPNSAPCTLEPAKENEKRDQWESNNATRRSTGVHQSQGGLGGGCAALRRLLTYFWRESNIYETKESRCLLWPPYWNDDLVLPCILVGCALIEQHW